MSTITFNSDVTSVIPPNRLFKAFLLDSDNLIPKIMPEAIQSVQNLEGDGGPGTIKLVTFGEGSPITSATHRIDEVDEANHVFKYTVIDGDALMGVLEFIAYYVKIEEGPDGGSVCKTTSTYQAKTEDHGISEDQIKMGNEKGEQMFRALEAYLLEHPDEYN